MWRAEPKDPKERHVFLFLDQTSLFCNSPIVRNSKQLGPTQVKKKILRLQFLKSFFLINCKNLGV